MNQQISTPNCPQYAPLEETINAGVQIFQCRNTDGTTFPPSYLDDGQTVGYTENTLPGNDILNNVNNDIAISMNLSPINSNHPQYKGNESMYGHLPITALVIGLVLYNAFRMRSKNKFTD